MGGSFCLFRRVGSSIPCLPTYQTPRAGSPADAVPKWSWQGRREGPSWSGNGFESMLRTRWRRATKRRWSARGAEVVGWWAAAWLARSPCSRIPTPSPVRLLGGGDDSKERGTRRTAWVLSARMCAGADGRKVGCRRVDRLRWVAGCSQCGNILHRRLIWKDGGKEERGVTRKSI